MKKSNAALLIAVAAMGLASSVVEAGTAEDARIHALEARFAAAVKARDIDAIMKTYSSDVFVFDVVPPRKAVDITVRVTDVYVEALTSSNLVHSTDILLPAA